MEHAKTGVSEIDKMLVGGLVLIGQSENSILAILALLKTQRLRLDWTELRERLLSRNYGGVAQGWLSTETGKEVSLSLSQSAAIELYKCGECHVLGIQLYCF